MLDNQHFVFCKTNHKIIVIQKIVNQAELKY